MTLSLLGPPCLSAPQRGTVFNEEFFNEDKLRNYVLV